MLNKSCDIIGILFIYVPPLQKFQPEFKLIFMSRQITL